MSLGIMISVLSTDDPSSIILAIKDRLEGLAWLETNGFDHVRSSTTYWIRSSELGSSITFKKGNNPSEEEQVLLRTMTTGDLLASFIRIHNPEDVITENPD